jgi:hypothetical protein
MWVSASRSHYIVFQKLKHEIALGKTHVTHGTRGARGPPLKAAELRRR